MKVESGVGEIRWRSSGGQVKVESGVGEIRWRSSANQVESRWVGL